MEYGIGCGAAASERNGTRGEELEEERQKQEHSEFSNHPHEVIRSFFLGLVPRISGKVLIKAFIGFVNDVNAGGYLQQTADLPLETGQQISPNKILTV